MKNIRTEIARANDYLRHTKMGITTELRNCPGDKNIKMLDEGGKSIVVTLGEIRDSNYILSVEYYNIPYQIEMLCRWVQKNTLQTIATAFTEIAKKGHYSINGRNFIFHPVVRRYIEKLL